MSDLDQIHAALERLFNAEGQRIVFWNDPGPDFQNMLPFLALDGVTVLRLDQLGALETKIRLERYEPEGKFLLYAPSEEPDYEDDWLLDIRLYSRSFRADQPSILLQELGLESQHLRGHLDARRKFFDAKERLQKLKNLVAPDDAAGDLDRKMLAVVAKADQPELFNLVRTIFHAWLDGEAEIDLDKPPGVWGQIERFELDGAFWQMVKASFGYEEVNPSLKNFLLQLMLTDYAHHLKADVPQSVRGLLLPRQGWSNTVVCLAQWRDSSSKQTSYDRLSAAAAAELKIEDHLPELEIGQILDVMTFLAVEKRIASSLRERVQSTADAINADDVRAAALRRQTGHWASLAVAGSVDAPREAFHAVYDALVAAADFFALRNQHKRGFDYPDAAAMYRAYETELYRFDQLYRHFCEAADLAEEQGWNIVKPLRAEIEGHYVHWYLTNLALAWGKFIEPSVDAPSGGLLSNWRIDGVPNQYRFYEGNVQPWLDEADNRRAFVKSALASGMKRFTIPCDFNGGKQGIYFYITNVPPPKHPLEDQARWLKEERGGVVPKEVMDSFERLQKIAHENNVSFVDLCVYALAAASPQKSDFEIDNLQDLPNTSVSPEESLPRLVQAKAALDQSPDDPAAWSRAADAYGEYGQRSLVTNAKQASVDALGESVRLRERLISRSPQNTEQRIALASALVWQAKALVMPSGDKEVDQSNANKANDARAGEYRAAYACLLRSLDVLEQTYHGQSDEAQRATLATRQRMLGELAERQGDAAAAVHWYARAVVQGNSPAAVQLAMLLQSDSKSDLTLLELLPTDLRRIYDRIKEREKPASKEDFAKTFAERTNSHRVQE